MKSYRLIQQESATVDEVLKDLKLQTPGTTWAGKTNGFAADYVRHLDEVYKGNWSKGFLPKEMLFEVLLPKHKHYIEAGDGPVIFPLDTQITEALAFYKNDTSTDARECMKAILALKESIMKEGFSSTIVLAVINDTLKHVDGLHRVLALGLAIEEGYEYKPIPVYLCNAS